MRLAHLLPPCVLAAALLAAARARAESVEMLVYPNPGLFEVAAEGPITGPGATLLARLATVSGLTLHLQAMPPARAMQTVTLNPRLCMAGIPRTPEREGQFRWAGQMASGALMLYGRANETREVRTPEDLRQAVIAAQRESQPLNWLREHELQAYVVNDTVTGLRMLRAGRVDFWLVNDLVGQRAVHQLAGAEPKPLRSFGRIDIHVACHREFPESLAERLRAGLEQMRRDGELAEFGLR